MPQIVLRILIGILAGFFFFLIIPLVFSAIGFPLPGNFIQILKLCIAALVVCYIIWGKQVPWT